jgi:hypothetical protein
MLAVFLPANAVLIIIVQKGLDGADDKASSFRMTIPFMFAVQV